MHTLLVHLPAQNTGGAIDHTHDKSLNASKKECKGIGASSLSDLKEIGCKSVWLVYISLLFRPIEQLLAFKIVKSIITQPLFRFDSSSLTDWWSSHILIFIKSITSCKGTA